MSSASTLFSMVKSSSEVPSYSHRAPSSSRVEPKSSRGVSSSSRVESSSSRGVPFLSRGAQCATGRTAANGLVIKTAGLDKAHMTCSDFSILDLEVERYLTSGSLHRTRQRGAAHVARHYGQAIVYSTQIHPHHLPYLGSFLRIPRIAGGHKITK